MKWKRKDKKKASYKKYYRSMAVMSAVGAVIWEGYCILDTFLPISRENIIVSYINLGFSLVMWLLLIFLNTKMLVFALRRDKKDELYKENKAKTDSLFIDVIYYVAIGLALISPSLQKVQFTFHSGFIWGILYLAFSVYNFIALYYEVGSENREKEKEEEGEEKAKREEKGES